MPFNSFEYFIFLPVVYLLFYFVGERARWIVLLAASLWFYVALRIPYLLAVLMVVAIATYAFGIWLDRAGRAGPKRALLWGGIATNVLILVAMKYLPFISENLQSLASLLSWDARIQTVNALVAIGVSYYIFQAISYLIDISLEIEKPERHFGYFLLYLAFFPKLLQGPIERAADLIPQLKKSYEFNYDNIRFGMLLFTWGLFKKVVIADRLALYVDAVYSDVHAFTGLPLILATYAYAFQIYMDFSGYTDMALGTAQMFNINLTQNFDRPYLATSTADFWRRWHITFSRWILDYIFKPLQMQWRDRKSWGTAAALIVAFLISGVWHGASWGFVIWGGLHGFYLACSVFYKPYQKKMHRALGLEKTRVLRLLQIFITFNLICLAWVFFRANDLHDAVYVLSNFFYGIKGFNHEFLLSQGRISLLTAIMSMCIMIFVAIYLEKLKKYFHVNIFFRWSVYYSLVFCVIFLGAKSKGTFIYFGF